jgi:hypothetical protein
MTDAPERIWAVPLEMHGAVMVGGWADTILQCPNGTEYVRADILAQTLAANAALVKRLEEAREALQTISDAHVPDQPATSALSELIYVRRHVAYLRALAAFRAAKGE